MEIRKMKSECDNCSCSGNNDLIILTMVNEIIILCPDCLRELKDAIDNLYLQLPPIK